MQGDGPPDVVVRVLGELAVRHRGAEVPIGHARQRAVLAVLALEAGQVVPTDSLLDSVWGERPPSRQRSVVRTYLSRLRRLLAPTGITITHQNRFLATLYKRSWSEHSPGSAGFAAWPAISNATGAR